MIKLIIRNKIEINFVQQNINSIENNKYNSEIMYQMMVAYNYYIFYSIKINNQYINLLYLAFIL